MADLVFWEPAFFGVKPEMIVKGGMIAVAQMGDPNASIPTPQPVHYRPMFATRGGALGKTSLTFVSQMAVDARIADRYGLQQAVVAVKNCRNVTKADMIHNAWQPSITVDPRDLSGGRRTANCSPAIPPPCCRWRSAISCSESPCVRSTNV